jgi:hypothetical protein
MNDLDAFAKWSIVGMRLFVTFALTMAFLAGGFVAWFVLTW